MGEAVVGEWGRGLWELTKLTLSLSKVNLYFTHIFREPKTVLINKIHF